MKLSREIKTAILVIAAILLFIWGYSFLKGKDLFRNYRTFYAEYDNVEGLSNSAIVTLNGLAIGKVDGIVLNPSNGKILVEMSISSDFPISKSSTAQVYEPGFIGGKQIAIIPNYKDPTPASNGQTLLSDVKLGLTSTLAGKLDPIQLKVNKLLTNADTLLTGVNNILDKKTQEDLKKSLSELSQTLAEFHKISANANAMIADNKQKISGVVTNFSTVSSNFVKISDSLQKADLGKTVKNLNKTLATVNGIMTTLQSGQGTMGKLMKDEGLYNNLAKTSKELELLLQDLRLYPTRYVNISLFGKKNKPYKAVSDTLTNLPTNELPK